jgi:hypothetical protein
VAGGDAATGGIVGLVVFWGRAHPKYSDGAKAELGGIVVFRKDVRILRFSSFVAASESHRTMAHRLRVSSRPLFPLFAGKL